jgi:5-methylcytosine-specific restriction endonuclease McrA
MKEYAKQFYRSKEWLKIKNIYMGSINYICERCSDIATICHHKKYINPANINDMNITLNYDNLEGLCLNCHNKEHSRRNNGLNIALFDDEGNMIGVKESREIKEYKKSLKQYDSMNPPQQ